jgi:hypothetical protein
MILQELQARELQQRIIAALPHGRIQAPIAADTVGGKGGSWTMMYDASAGGASAGGVEVSELQQVLDSTLVIAEKVRRASAMHHTLYCTHCTHYTRCAERVQCTHRGSRDKAGHRCC